MASMDPWKKLGRTAEACLKNLSDPAKEVYVVRAKETLAGFIVLDMHSLVRGYIQTVCVDPAMQGQGIGTRLIGFAEERIGRESPNVFICVSSFNPDARRLYKRLGYRVVGTLTDFMIEGSDEILMRKTSGPWKSFKRT